MHEMDKAIIEKLIGDQIALQDECDKLGLDWIGFKMDTVINALREVKSIPDR